MAKGVAERQGSLHGYPAGDVRLGKEAYHVSGTKPHKMKKEKRKWRGE